MRSTLQVNLRSVGSYSSSHIFNNNNKKRCVANTTQVKRKGVSTYHGELWKHIRNGTILSSFVYENDKTFSGIQHLLKRWPVLAHHWGMRRNVSHVREAYIIFACSGLVGEFHARDRWAKERAYRYFRR